VAQEHYEAKRSGARTRSRAAGRIASWGKEGPLSHAPGANLRGLPEGGAGGADGQSGAGRLAVQRLPQEAGPVIPPREIKEAIIVAYRTGKTQERLYWSAPLECLVTLTVEHAPDRIPVRATPVRRRKRRARRKA